MLMFILKLRLALENLNVKYLLIGDCQRLTVWTLVLREYHFLKKSNNIFHRYILIQLASG